MINPVPSLSGTFGIPARFARNPKMPKEPSNSTLSNARIEQECINEQIGDETEQGQRTTMYKNNSRNSSDFKDCEPLQLSCNLTGMKPAIGYYSYTNR